MSGSKATALRRNASRRCIGLYAATAKFRTSNRRDRPRTAAWADRYGGKFDAVRKLIDDSIEAKRQSLAAEWRSRRNRWVAAIVAVAAILGVGAWFAMLEKGRQEGIDISAMTSAKSLLKDVLDAYSDKSLDLAGAESLATISGQFLNDTRAASKTSAADLVWAQALNVDADLQAKLSRNTEALALARKAKEAAQSLTQSRPNDREPLQALYDASIRVGTALSALGRAHKDDALKEYNAALGTAETIVSLSSDEVGDDDVIDAHMKIGDIHKDNDLKQYSQARTEYQFGLAACQAALAKHPQSFNLLRDKGKAFFRIAQLLSTEKTQGTFDEAATFYRQASEVQEALVTRNAQDALASQKAPDASLKSNLAATYTNWGVLEKDGGDLKLALVKLQQGVALHEELTKDEPGNPQWEEYLAPSYLYIAETLDGLNRPDEALAYYRKLADARRTLAYRSLGRPNAQKELAQAAQLLGDRSAGLAQIEAYRESVRTWNRLVDDPRIATAAADQYDVVMGFAKAFDAQKDWPDAQAAYRVAMKVAVLNYVKDPSNTAWRDKAEEAERDAVVAAGQAAQSAPADAPHPARSAPVSSP